MPRPTRLPSYRLHKAVQPGRRRHPRQDALPRRPGTRPRAGPSTIGSSPSGWPTAAGPVRAARRRPETSPTVDEVLARVLAARRGPLPLARREPDRRAGELQGTPCGRSASSTATRPRADFGPLALRAVRDEMVRSRPGADDDQRAGQPHPPGVPLGRVGRAGPRLGRPGALATVAGLQSGPHRGPRAEAGRAGPDRARRGRAALPVPAGGRDGPAPAPDRHAGRARSWPCGAAT